MPPCSGKGWLLCVCVCVCVSCVARCTTFHKHRFILQRPIEEASVSLQNFTMTHIHIQLFNPNRSQRMLSDNKNNVCTYHEKNCKTPMSLTMHNKDTKHFDTQVCKINCVWCIVTMACFMLDTRGGRLLGCGTRPPPPCPPGQLSCQASTTTGHTHGGAEGNQNFFFIPLALLVHFAPQRYP